MTNASDSRPPDPSGGGNGSKRRVSRSATSVGPMGAAAVAVVLVMGGALIALWLRPPIGRPDEGAAAESPSGVLQAHDGSTTLGYPGPSPMPTLPPPTLEPDPGGRFPPPEGVVYQIVSISQSEHAATLTKLEHLLTTEAADDLSAWVGSADDVLTLDYYSESEGIGARPSAPDVEAILEDLFIADSEPVIQGYFDPSGGNSVSGASVFVVLTGLRGQVPMPTKDPAEILGRPAPGTLPIDGAVWELYASHNGDVWWRAWWLGDGYYQLVGEFAERGLGTYYVLR